ncbi:MAG: nuclear transport factor 2 family protein [Reichenbachiella sp.]|uniref:YybH family protein n=1 Tax=Reichenbachiella sp. TaxID=2184521 RepID=UPI002966EA3D|nr:nuclear transport factor 2 family protein [Reichenbachiella sp.]MDW3212245.1 nuclear transport factor 2 family protein [Reichenbachiella sp.]
MKTVFVFITCATALFSCRSTVLDIEKRAVQDTIERHLDAVANRDINHLKGTIPEKGQLLLILPGQEILNTTEAFLDYHLEWFEDNSWTFESKIIHVQAGAFFGMAVVEVLYKEPDRDGKPYFNRMIVSYDFEKQNGKWVVIKDHASSIEQSSNL